MKKLIAVLIVAGILLVCGCGVFTPRPMTQRERDAYQDFRIFQLQNGVKTFP
jgi:hypothetical protein